VLKRLLPSAVTDYSIDSMDCVDIPNGLRAVTAATSYQEGYETDAPS